MGAMRMIVMELSAWVGVAGLSPPARFTVLVALFAGQRRPADLFFAKRSLCSFA